MDRYVIHIVLNLRRFLLAVGKTWPETQDVKPDNVLFVDAAYLQGKLEMALTCADLIGWEQDIMDITGNSGLKPGHCQFDIEAD